MTSSKLEAPSTAFPATVRVPIVVALPGRSVPLLVNAIPPTSSVPLPDMTPSLVKVFGLPANTAPEAIFTVPVFIPSAIPRASVPVLTFVSPE